MYNIHEYTLHEHFVGLFNQVHVLLCVCVCLSLSLSPGWQPDVSERLQRYVEEENGIFSLEIAEYDEKQKILPAQHVRWI